MSTPDRLIPPDYHSHTILCKHAEGIPLDYARSAKANGLTSMAATEHAPAPEPFSPGIRMAMDDFGLYHQWIREANSVEGIDVLLGIEADYYDQCEPFLEKWLAEHPFDYVLGSVHFLAYHRERDHALEGIWDSDDLEGIWSRYFARIQRLADSRLYDVAAHLDLPKKYKPVPDQAIVEQTVKPALDRIAEAGMGIEINTSGFNHQANEQYPSVTILAWACERGIPISFGSDSHQPQRMGADFDRAVQAALEAGYTERAEYRGRERTLVPLIAVPD